MNHYTKKKHGRTVTSRPKSASSSSRTAKELVQRPLLQEYSAYLLRNSLPRNTSSFTGLDKNRIIGAPYASTSHYLRQLVNGEVGNQHSSAGKANQGSPAYKTPEEYYDEVIALKKQIQDLTNENAVLKLKVQRTEEEYHIKKQQNVEQQYMDSSKVDNNLRQKLANLERALREKDLAFSKLQSDLKATKLEEMRVRMDVYLNEIQRLKKCQASNKVNQASSSSLKVFATDESPKRTDDLIKTLHKMGTDKARLVQENKLLKEDLQRCMEKQHRSADSRYEEMTRQELLSALAKLEQKTERTESNDHDLMKVKRLNKPDTEDKLPLEGGLVQRLDQLDKRESELLEDLSKKKSVIAQLREDRMHFREKCNENEIEIKRLRQEIATMQDDLVSSRHDNRSDISRRQSVVSGRQSPHSISARSSFSKPDHGQQLRIDAFRHNRAAKVIQRGWRQYENHNEDVELIQSTLTGHHLCKANLSRLKGHMAEMDQDDSREEEEEDTEEDDAIQKIQSTMKGHHFRTQLLARRLSSASSVHSFSGRTQNSGSIQSPRHSYSVSGQMPPPGLPRPEFSGRYTPTRLISYESDDDVTTRSSRRGPVF